MSTPLAKRQRILITGAAGFVGFHVVHEALSRGFEVVALDALLGGLYDPQEKVTRWEKLEKLSGIQLLNDDLRRTSWFEGVGQIDSIINLAAMPGLRLSWSDFELYRGCNLDGVANLIQFARNQPIKKFLQISTSSVYGKLAVGDEQTPTRPVSPYGVSKLAAENLLLAHFLTNELPVSVLRYFSVYGPEQRPDMAYRRFIERALRDEPIIVFGDGTQSRTNTFVQDVAVGTIDALDGAKTGEVYNICGSEEYELNNVISIILEETGSKSEIVTEDRVPGDQDRTNGENHKASADFGFNPHTSLRKGLQEEIAWVKNRVSLL